MLKLECDGAIIHSVLSKFPSKLDFEQCIESAQNVYKKYPSAKLQKLANVFLEKEYVCSLF